MKNLNLVLLNFTLLVLLHVSTIACGAELYRWTDNDGRVHYSDTVPDAQKSAAKPIDLTNAQITDAQRQEALARYAQEKSALQQTSPAVAPAPPTLKRTPAISASDDFPAGRKACEEEWRKYRASAACFAPFSVVGGGVKAEAFNHCTEMKMPALCR